MRSGRLQGTWAALALALVLASPEADAADAKTSSLSWLRMPGADSCAATQPLARAVEDRLGRSALSPPRYRQQDGTSGGTLHRPEAYVLTADVGVGFFFREPTNADNFTAPPS